MASSSFSFSFDDPRRAGVRRFNVQLLLRLSKLTILLPFFSRGFSPDAR